MGIREDTERTVTTTMDGLNLANYPRSALISELKTKVAAELQSNDITQSRLNTVIYETIKRHYGPSNPEEDRRLQASASELAEKLYQARLNLGVAQATTLFNQTLDRSTSLPVSNGTLIGAGIGLGAAAYLDVGDWQSFTGILKKLGIITAGVAAGALISGDLRPSAFMPPAPRTPTEPGRG
jgi:hypothetical protein